MNAVYVKQNNELSYKLQSKSDIATQHVFVSPSLLRCAGLNSRGGNLSVCGLGWGRVLERDRSFDKKSDGNFMRLTYRFQVLLNYSKAVFTQGKQVFYVSKKLADRKITYFNLLIYFFVKLVKYFDILCVIRNEYP